jgi:hypothetical protein
MATAQASPAPNPTLTAQFPVLTSYAEYCAKFTECTTALQKELEAEKRALKGYLQCLQPAGGADAFECIDYKCTHTPTAHITHTIISLKPVALSLQPKWGESRVRLWQLVRQLSGRGSTRPLFSST